MFVSPIWDPSGEERRCCSNIHDFTDEDDDLQNLLFLGAYLGLNVKYHIDRIRFENCWQKGYIGVLWLGRIESCGFEMHLSVAKWDVLQWRREACFSYEQGIKDMTPVYELFEQWAIRWSPRLLEICQFEAGDAIGAKKYDGGWRTIMKPKGKLLLKLLRDVKGQLDNSLAIGPYNQVTNLHFSLDRWWGCYPDWIKADLF